MSASEKHATEQVHVAHDHGGKIACGSHTVAVSRPNTSTVLIQVLGDVDLAAAERLRDLLQPRLNSCLRAVILDFSEVSFCSSACVELVQECRYRADAHDMALSVIAPTPGPVTRLLWLVAPSLLDVVEQPPNETTI